MVYQFQCFISVIFTQLFINLDIQFIFVYKFPPNNKSTILGRKSESTGDALF